MIASGSTGLKGAVTLHWQRSFVLQRDGFRCIYCGLGVGDGVRLEVDHIAPVAAGGPHCFYNLATACRFCNRGFGDRPKNLSPEMMASIMASTDRCLESFNIPRKIRNSGHLQSGGVRKDPDGEYHRFALVLGRVLAAYREKRGYTQESFASSCGWDQGHWSHIENGRKMSLMTLVKAANSFDMTVQELLRDAVRHEGPGDGSPSAVKTSSRKP